MNWLVYALVSPALYAIVNFIDKYVLSRQIKDYRGVIIYTGIVAFFFGSIVWLLTGMPSLPLQSALIVLFAGMLLVFAGAIYFKVLSTEETSSVILLFQAIPVFVLIFSYIFLHETITALQLVGFFLILAASIELSMGPRKKNKKIRFHLSRAFYLIMVCDVLWALAAVLMKFAINANSFTKILSYESWGLGVGSLVLFILFPEIRGAFLKTQRSMNRQKLAILVGNEVIFATSKALGFLAYSLGPVALVSVLGSTQTFIGILYGWILTLFFPLVFKEDVSKRGLIRKFALAGVTAYGIWILS